jgi:DNA-binding transcriptional ArsR family regulator
MNTLFNALAEPNRMRIVELLRDGPHSVNEIVAQLQLSQPLVSKHLRVLSQAGLVTVRPNAQQRIYQLEAQPFEELDGWLAGYRKLWETRLDRLDEYLQEVKKAQKQAPS